MIDCEKVKKLALENGFKLKEQASGNLDLNSYVYDFAEALLKNQQAEIDSLKAQLAKIESGEFVVVPKSKLNTYYWDEANNGVGYYELFDTLEEAKKAAAHYKATIEAGY
ncbi:hypothetical protein [Acinetobacter soli]|uniref:hypothetical protein n=1 Tax=Acinetobacter soli TaxID=487316 RepID=UPI00124BF1F0|nr:hypothetical protein [Acinetobacter soli]